MEVDVSRGGRSAGESSSGSLNAELYFLIAKFLATGPCQEAARALKQELAATQILPQRLDWLGSSHNQSFEELERKYPHIETQHLLQICARIGPILEKEVPPCVPGAISLLGAGRQSVLRTKEVMSKYVRNIVSFSGRNGGKPFLDPAGFHLQHSLVKVLQGRENSGAPTRRDLVPTSFYKNLQLHRHTLGHLSAVYCVLFDRTGKYIVTGADDLLIKVWSAVDGRLLTTFRGASGEIMDLALNFDNTLLAAGSLDRLLRVWCFQTMSPIAVLSAHSGMITSVNFCPLECKGVNYLVTTSNDGSVAFWAHAKDGKNKYIFNSKPIQYNEKMRPGQAQMICASFSPGGAFMAAGSADHHVRVYAMLEEGGPKRILEIEAHSDTVDSIQWAHKGLRFISGSKDGTADLWVFEEQQWQSRKLFMMTKIPGETNSEEDTTKKIKVTMVCWDVSDDWVVTAVNDTTLKVWNSRTTELVKVLKGHKDEVYVLESHPIDPRVILSAGHDGQLIIWDIMKSEPIACFQNFIQGQGNCAIFDAKWSPDGTMLAATDSHGHLIIYGFGSGVQRLKIIPKELFFHTDYRPLIRDANNYVLDEQTQTAPHLMPPPFLVDVDGNPYPPGMQRLVPGREHCRGEQLVPNIAVGASGNQEVIEGVPGQEPRSNIDRLIEALAQRQNINAEANPEENEDENNQLQDLPVRQMASPRAARSGVRRIGDVEGIRQTSGNWQRDNTTPWNKPILARPLNPAVYSKQYKETKALAKMELEIWKQEMKKKPQAQPNTPAKLEVRKKNKARHGYRTRAAVGDGQEGEDEEDFENNATPSGSSSDSESNQDLPSESSTSESSTEYSDWIADHGVNLEPPKRSKRKPVQKRPVTPLSDKEKKARPKPKKKTVPIRPEPNEIREVPDIFRPPEWLSSTIPRKAPYYPQMGDEIVYFRQGHQMYLNAVRTKKIYETGHCEPWNKIQLRAQEFVKVIGIKYEIRPPRLCCLKLGLMDEEGQLTRQSFTIKYHDMPDVLDFLVLKQTFDNALNRQWSEGNRFRCIIDDAWWIGTITSVEPADEDFPDSYFMCFQVRWDNGETEKMSPWDLEPMDENRLPEEIGAAVPLLKEEINEILYKPQKEEWPNGDREAACRRIIRGLDQVMALAIAEPFVAPVDLSTYPAYAFVVEYPIDLSTIKARFENFFYRRITSAQFDIRYLATNAEKFNESESDIVKKARIVTELCLRIIKEKSDCDVSALYHQINDTYQSTSDSEVDVEDINQPSTSTQRNVKKSKPLKRNRVQTLSQDWRKDCWQLFETIWQSEDSIPFREPVDELQHPDYYKIIDMPMDLQNVKEDLIGGNYESPLDFAKDMRLIFNNSRNFNTNKRSQIFTMTVRLSNLFEGLMNRIISHHKSTQRKNSSKKSKSKPKSRTSRKPKPKTHKKPINSSRNVIETSDEDEELVREMERDYKEAENEEKYNKVQMEQDGGEEEDVEEEGEVEDEDDDDDDDDVDDDDDDDDDDEDNEDEDEINLKIENTPPKARTLRNFDEPGPSRMTNGHSRSANLLQSSLRTRSSRKTPMKKNRDSEQESQGSESDYGKRTVRKMRPKKSINISNGYIEDSESEDDYKPSPRGKQTRTLRAKNNRTARPSRTKRKPLNYDENIDSEDEEVDEDDNDSADNNDKVDNNSSDYEESQNSDDGSEDDVNVTITRNKPILESDVSEPEPERNFREISDHDYAFGEIPADPQEELEEFAGKIPSFDEEDSENEDESQGFETNRCPNTPRNKRPVRNTRNHSNTKDTSHHLRRSGLKRPHYKECSDESDNGHVMTRRKVKRMNYGETSDDDTQHSNSTVNCEGPSRTYTVSRSGRVCKPTPKVLALQ